MPTISTSHQRLPRISASSAFLQPVNPEGILQNEFYCGTLVCHKTYVSKINHIKKEIPPEEQYRHENAVPAIVSKEIWKQAQLLLSEKPKRNVRASSGKPCHRYAGLIKCGDCNASFVCRTRKWGDKPDRYEYTCNGNHRYGKSHCTRHSSYVVSLFQQNNRVGISSRPG